MQFQSSHPGYEYLRKKWISKHADTTQKFWQKHGDIARHLAVGGLGGMMLLTIPGTTVLQNTAYAQDASHSAVEGITKAKDTHKQLADSLKPLIPANDEVRPLTSDEEDKISQTLTAQLGINVKPEINNIKLNRSYGLIGGEQHLYRYPGDTLYEHANNLSDWAMYGPAGMAPGLGAWGYFASSRDQLSQQDADRERWYIAVQTFLAPGYAENVKQYHDFFKYRKMVVVNPKTGQAVVADIADAGPSEWTGKQLGGSPEVMEAVGLAGGPRKGAVLYFFVDDPNNQIPLGPIEMKEVVK